MSEIRYMEFLGIVEAQVDDEGKVRAWDYAVERYTRDSDFKEEEVRLMAGQADSIEDAERNVRAKLADLDRPSL